MLKSLVTFSTARKDTRLRGESLEVENPIYVDTHNTENFYPSQIVPNDRSTNNEYFYFAFGFSMIVGNHRD